MTAPPEFPVEKARRLLERLIPETGSVPALRVQKAARAAGVPWWAVRKARCRLDVQVSRRGFGADGYWEWSWQPPFTWTPPAPDPPPPPVCAWAGCQEPPRTMRSVYCATHRLAARRRTKAESERRFRALRRRVVARVRREVAHGAAVDTENA